MFLAFLLTKLFRPKNISVYSATNPATFLHQRALFLRRISSNTSYAADAQLSSQSSPAESAESSSKRLEYPPPPLISTSSRRKELNRDYTVSYLVESCGLSPKDAASASEKVHFATQKKPDSVLDLLRTSQIVRKHPSLLLINAEKIILPKLEFLYSMGLSKNDLVTILCYNPVLLTRSLKNQIKPVCKWIKSFVQSDERVCTAIKHSPWIFTRSPEKILVPKMELLQKLAMTVPNIALLLMHFPSVLVQNHETFSAGVNKVREMGFDPSKATFVLALHALSGKGKKQIWERCYKIYSTKWGWSDEDILTAFKKHPHCMTFSEKKLNSAMDFLVNTMGWSSKRIANCPVVLTYSLEKRLKPRCRVIRVLWSKDLLSKDLNPSTMLLPVENDFLKTYVTRFQEQVPQLLSLYQGKMDALDLQ